MQRPVTRRGLHGPVSPTANPAAGLASQQSHQGQQQCQQLTLQHSAASISLSDLNDSAGTLSIEASSNLNAAGTPLLQQQTPPHDVRISRPQHKQLRVQVQDGLPAAPGAYAAVVSTARNHAHVLHVHDSSAQPRPAAELSGRSESFLSVSSSDIQIVHSVDDLTAAALAQASHGGSGAGQHTHKQPQKQQPLVSKQLDQFQHQLRTHLATGYLKQQPQSAAAMPAQLTMQQPADDTYSDDNFEEASQASLPAASATPAIPSASAQHMQPPSAAVTAAAAAAAAGPNSRMPGPAAADATVPAADATTAGAVMSTAGGPQAQAPAEAVSQQFNMWAELEQLHRSLPLANLIRRASSTSSSSSDGSKSSSTRYASSAGSSRSSRRNSIASSSSGRNDSNGAAPPNAEHKPSSHQSISTAGTEQQHLHLPHAPAAGIGSGSSSTAMRRSSSSSRRQSGHSDMSTGQQQQPAKQQQQQQQQPKSQEQPQAAAPIPHHGAAAAAPAAAVGASVRRRSMTIAESGARDENAAAQAAAAAAATEALLSSLQVVQEGRRRRARQQHREAVSSSGNLAGAAAVRAYAGGLQAPAAAERRRAVSWQGGSDVAQTANVAAATTAKDVTHVVHAAQHTSINSSGSGSTAHVPPTRQHKSVAVQVGSMNDKAIQVIFDSAHNVLSEGPDTTTSTSTQPAGLASAPTVPGAGSVLFRPPLQGVQSTDPAAVQRALAAVLAKQGALLGAGDITDTQGLLQRLSDALAAALVPQHSSSVKLGVKHSTGAAAVGDTRVQAVEATAGAMPPNATAAAGAAAAGGPGAGLSQLLSELGVSGLPGSQLGLGLPLSASVQQLRTAALQSQLQGLVQRLQQQQQQLLLGHVMLQQHVPETGPSNQQQQQQLQRATSPMLAAVQQVQRLQELRQSLGLPVQPGLAMLQQQLWLQQKERHFDPQAQPLLQTQQQQQQQQQLQQQQQSAPTLANHSNGMQHPPHVRFAEPFATTAPIAANLSAGSTEETNPGAAETAAASAIVAAAEPSALETAAAAVAAAPAATPWFTIPLPGQQQGPGGSSSGCAGSSGSGQTVTSQTAPANPEASAAGADAGSTASAIAAAGEPQLSGNGSTADNSGSEEQGWITLPFLGVPAAAGSAAPAAAPAAPANVAAPLPESTIVPAASATAAAAAPEPQVQAAEVTAGEGWFSLSLPAQQDGPHTGSTTAAAAAAVAAAAASAPGCQAETSAAEGWFSLAPAAAVNCGDPAAAAAVTAAEAGVDATHGPPFGDGSRTIGMPLKAQPAQAAAAAAAVAVHSGAVEPEFNAEPGVQHSRTQPAHCSVPTGSKTTELDMHKTSVQSPGSSEPGVVDAAGGSTLLAAGQAQQPAESLRSVCCQTSQQATVQQQQQQPQEQSAAAGAEVSDLQQGLITGESLGAHGVDAESAAAVPPQGACPHAVAADLAAGNTAQSTLPRLHAEALMQLEAGCTGADGLAAGPPAACAAGPALEAPKVLQGGWAQVVCAEAEAEAIVAAAEAAAAADIDGGVPAVEGQQAHLQATLHPAAGSGGAIGSLPHNRQQANNAAAAALKDCNAEGLVLQPSAQQLLQQPGETQAQQLLQDCRVTESQESSSGCLAGPKQQPKSAWQSVQQLRQQQEQQWAPRPSARSYSPLNTLRRYQAFLQAQPSTGAAMHSASAAVLQQQLAQAVSAAEQHKRGYVAVGSALRQLQQVRALLDSRVANMEHKRLQGPGQQWDVQGSRLFEH